MEKPHPQVTTGVKTLRGDPKKAIIKLAIPMIIAMASHTVYNVVDAIWVSGLGADALSAVGFFFPFFFMLIAIATGLSIGGGSAISRFIGARDKAGADSVAIHTIVLMLLISVALAVPLFIFSPDLFIALGAGSVIDMVVAYARVMFAGTTALFFVYVGTAILRSEGDARPAMVAIVLGALLNIALDPIFIYTLGLGVAGAAWATVIAMLASGALTFYWLFLKRITYVAFPFRFFRFSKDTMMSIMRVGLPASIQQLSMSFTLMILNFILVNLGGTDAVAVYTTGWRVVTIAILPLLGISTAVVAVVGATFGAQAFQKLRTAFTYAIRMGLLIEICIATAIFIFAPQITLAFTSAPEAQHLAEDLTFFLRVMGIFYPFAALGIISSATFQGVARGTNALVATLIRSLGLVIPATLVFAITFSLGVRGVWFGIILGNSLGSLIAFTWAYRYVGKLLGSSRGQKPSRELAVE